LLFYWLLEVIFHNFLKQLHPKNQQKHNTTSAIVKHILYNKNSFIPQKSCTFATQIIFLINYGRLSFGKLQKDKRKIMHNVAYLHFTFTYLTISTYEDILEYNRPT
jgi:hypothetical protein